MKSLFPRLCAVAVGTALLTSAYYRTSSASVMTEAANRFLASLTAEQRAKATFPFADAERVNWFFVPIERKGLPLREMGAFQRHLASALLSAGLSQAGYMKAVTIMSLEDVLRILEKDSGERRNPEKYYFSIFGTPSDTGAWGYRVEGHHLRVRVQDLLEERGAAARVAAEKRGLITSDRGGCFLPPALHHLGRQDGQQCAPPPVGLVIPALKQSRVGDRAHQGLGLEEPTHRLGVLAQLVEHHPKQMAAGVFHIRVLGAVLD